MKIRQNSLAKNVLTLMILSIFLKGIGFVNRIVIAYVFGTNNHTDIFYTSSGFVEAIGAILLEGLSIGLIKIYRQSKHDRERNEVLVTKLLFCVEITMIVLSLILFVFSREISIVLAPSYTGELSIILAKYIRIMGIVLLFYGITNVYSAILQAEERFIPVKMTGTVSSVCSIVAILLLSRRMGETSMSVSFLCAAICNCVFISICTKRYLKLSFDRSVDVSAEIKQLLKMSIPLTIGLAAHEVNLIIDKSVATSIGAGAVSALSYCSVVYLLVENVIISSTITAIYPKFVEFISLNDDQGIAAQAKKTTVNIILLLMPIVAVMFFKSNEIIRVLFYRGSFNDYSLKLTEYALKGYILGIQFRAVRDIISRMFYAYGNTKTSMSINLISIAINIALDFLLYKSFGTFGITFATTISLVFSGMAHYIAMCKYNPSMKVSKVKWNLLFPILIFFTVCVTANVFIVIQSNILSIIIYTMLVLFTEIVLLRLFCKEKFYEFVIIVKRLIS